MSRSNSGGGRFDDTDSRDASSQSDVVMSRTDSPKTGDLPKTSAQTERPLNITGQQQGINATKTNDFARLKCREMLTDVLQSGE